MTVTRVSLGHEKMVYVIVASKNMKYAWGKSPIVYIGTTKKGAGRMAQSAAKLTDKVLAKYGVRHFHVRMLTCAPRQSVATWRELERALLLTFKNVYGEIPEFNRQGKGFRPRDEFKLFSRDRLENLLRAIKDSGPDGATPKRRRNRRTHQAKPGIGRAKRH